MARQTESKSKPRQRTTPAPSVTSAYAIPWRAKQFHHPARDQGIIGRAAQALRDELETVEKTARNRGRPSSAIDFFAGERRIEKQDGFAVDSTFQMQMKLGQGHIIEVPMNAAEMEAIVGGYHG